MLLVTAQKRISNILLKLVRKFPLLYHEAVLAEVSPIFIIEGHFFSYYKNVFVKLFLFLFFLKLIAHTFEYNIISYPKYLPLRILSPMKYYLNLLCSPCS